MKAQKKMNRNKGITFIIFSNLFQGTLDIFATYKIFLLLFGSKVNFLYICSIET